MLNHFWNAATLTLGVFLSALGLGSFLLPNHFIDGGITGISMLLADQSGWPLPIFLVIVNIPFVILGYRHLGSVFALKSAVAITGLAICLAVIAFPVATSDKLLGAVFGGFFLGAGVGLAIRSRAVLDGTEVFALLASMRTFATVGEIVLVLNVVIFSIAALFLGIEPALYSILTYFAASKTIDYLLHGIEAYNGILIVTQQPVAVRQAILSELGRGVTIFKGKGGFSDADAEILLCVVTRLEVMQLESLVARSDSNAFIVTLPVLETKGGLIKQRPFH